MLALRSVLLALVALFHAVQARIIVVHNNNEQLCYDDFDNLVPCPKKPVDMTRVIIIVVALSVFVLIAASAFLFMTLRRRRARYQQLATPPPSVMHQGGGIIAPPPPGEMGYAGPQPQLPYPPPQAPYNAPGYTPSPASTAYNPPQGPPPPPPQSQGAAATYYGYSAAPI